MPHTSYPSPTHNTGAVTELEYERLTNRQAPDGVLALPSDPPMAYADGIGGRAVHIRVNYRALVRGFLYDAGSTGADVLLTANSSGSTRIDLVVLRLNRATWEVRPDVVQGTPGAGVPSPVNQTGGSGFWDLPLASVTVANGATSLAADTVTPLAWCVNDDGLVLCTPTTRPPHLAGRAIFEPATGTHLTSDGTAWRAPGTPSFATVTDRNTTFPTAQYGQMATVNATGELYLYNGTAWVGARPRFVRKTAEESVSSTTTLQPDDHLFFSVEANSLYQARFVLLPYSSSTGPDMRVAFSFPAGGALAWASLNLQTGAAGTVAETVNWYSTGNETTSPSGIAGVGLTPSGGPATLDVLLTTGANAGTLQLMWSQLVAGATTTRMQAGSHATCLKVG